jgi:lysophospholipase L1-like esterase
MLLAFAVPVEASNPVPPPIFLALGDSISTGFGLSGYTPGEPHEGSFVTLAAETLNMTPVSFAVDGLTSGGLLAMLENPGDELKDALAGAAVISLQIGGNDLLRLLPLVFIWCLLRCITM